MKERIIINLSEIVGSPNCISAEHGQRVYENIATLMLVGNRILLNFDQVEIVTPTFLNASVGQLYDKFSSHRIRELVSVQGLATDDLVLLKRIVDNAKRYFQNGQGCSQTNNDF